MRQFLHPSPQADILVEPLCVGADIAGALAAAASICLILTAVKKNTQDSPSQAAQLLDEVHGTAGSLRSLQSLLLDEEALDHLLARLLPVESVLTVVTGCVSTLSQLQEVVDYLVQWRLTCRRPRQMGR